MDLNGSHEGATFGSTAASSAASTSPTAHVSPTSTSTPAAGANPGVKRRAPIACRRCRRMRSKCIHDKATPPCKSCGEAGLSAEDCVFPARGQPDHDRDYRHPRTRAERPKGAAAKAKRAEGAVMASSVPPADPWDNLPPLEDLIDGVNRFTRYYFQLGFLAKKQYPEKLRKDHRSCNVFLLLSILSISARLSPALRARYGTGVKAAEFFIERASQMTLGELYAEPTLERCQAFYLLSIAQQGNGLRNKSYINMGVAIRMATLMMLHREDTYKLAQTTPELIMRSESARRTIWMLHSQDNLHSGPLSPVSLSASDITTLLPCDEDDFAQARQPASRAALDGTQPARENPALVSDKNRSLFASLMQIHHLWGIVGRHAVTFSRSPNPWDCNSQFSKMVTKLSEWEASLPAKHLYSDELLRSYKADGEDLAYLCVTMMTRLCNIVLRRPYLVDFVRRNVQEPRQQEFFSAMSSDLFRNVRGLYEQIDAQFTNRTPDESVGAQIASFCVYSCGLFSTYLCKYPAICPDASIAAAGPMMLDRTIMILNESKEVWPLAARWADALERFSRDPQTMLLTTEGSMDDGKDPIPRAIRPNLPPPISKSAASVAAAAAMPDRALPLPGSQPGSTSSTAMNSPRNSILLNPLPQNNPIHPPPSSHFASSMNLSHSSPPQHQPPQMNHYHTQPPGQQPQQYMQHGQQHFTQSHHSPPQQQPAHMQPMAGHSPYHATPAQVHGMPTPGSNQHHPRSVYWPPGGAPTPPASMPANLGRDGVGMPTDAFDGSNASAAQPQPQPQPQQQQAYLHNPTMAAEVAAFFPDGFEHELMFYIDPNAPPNGANPANPALHADQWLGTTGAFT